MSLVKYWGAIFGIIGIRQRDAHGDAEMNMNDSADDETPSDTPELRRHIGATLAESLWLRFHVGMLVGSTIGVGFIASVALQRYAPLQAALGWRYVVASVVAYAWFLLAVRWWVRYLAGIRPPIGDEEEDRGRFDVRALKQHDKREFRDDGRPKPDGCGDGCIDPGCFDSEAILVVGGFLALFWAIFWIYSTGPLILIEVATETLLAGGLLRWARRTEAAWMTRSVRATAIPFLITTTALFIIGLWASHRCPAATRFGEVWDCLL